MRVSPSAYLTLICGLPDAIQGGVKQFLSDGVVATSVIVGSVFLPSNESVRVVQLAIVTSSNFINNGRFC